MNECVCECVWEYCAHINLRIPALWQFPKGLYLEINARLFLSSELFITGRCYMAFNVWLARKIHEYGSACLCWAEWEADGQKNDAKWNIICYYERFVASSKWSYRNVWETTRDLDQNNGYNVFGWRHPSANISYIGVHTDINAHASLCIRKPRNPAYVWICEMRWAQNSMRTNLKTADAFVAMLRKE